MKSDKGTPMVPPVDVDIFEVRKIITSMSTILHNSLHGYWFSPADAKSAIDASYETLALALKKYGRLAVRMFDGALVVNGVNIPELSPEIRQFVAHLKELEVDNFTLIDGLSGEDFFKFSDLITAHAEEMRQLGGFINVLHRFSVANVESRKMIFREITEDEVVVSRDDAGNGTGAGSGGGDGSQPAQSREMVGNILAFLKGDVSAGHSEAVSEVRELAEDSNRMAELILGAAQVQRQSVDIESGETLIDFVVGCLKRTYDGLKDDKTYKTKKGKKKLTRNLLLLEEQLIDRMREISDEWTEEDLDAIVVATEGITDEILMDSLVDEYVVKREASDVLEQQLVEFIAQKGVEHAEAVGLPDKLSAKGYGLDGWQELIIKSRGAGPGSGGGSESEAAAGGQGGSGPGDGSALGSVMDAMGRLDALLDHMEKAFEMTEKHVREKNSDQLLNTLSDINHQVRVLAETTGTRIRELVDGLTGDAGEIAMIEQGAIDSGRKLNLTRGRAFELVSVIIGEIFEPLAMIQSSLDMLASKSLGGISDSQNTALRLAGENVGAVRNLLTQMKQVAAVA